jgi:uncharacterized membrane protein
MTIGRPSGLPLKAGIETVKDSGLKGASTIKDKVSEAVGGDNDGDKGKDKMKFINIVEELDLPVPRAVAYKAWTQFEEFPSFMKKVENVEQQEDQTVEWKTQIFWSSSASSSRGTTAKKSTTSSSRSRS